MAQNRSARLWCELLEDRRLMSSGLYLTGVEFRTIDGTENNVANPTQGAAETRQIRFGYGAQFPDGFGDAIITTPQRENPRTVSNTIHAQEGSVPSARQLTDWAFQWGQWITHDLDLTGNGPEYDTLSTGAVGDFSIPILDADDPLGPNPIPFHRSEFDPATGTPDPFPGTTRLNRREVMNNVTSYIDASMVYGSDAARAAELRTFEGGKLKTSGNGLLPLNEAGLDNADPFGLADQLFLAGDVRANEQVGLAVTHTLFVREHNRLATRIAELYPQLTGEQIYQVARRIVGAEIQIITYEEYLPAVLGPEWAPRPEDAVYSADVNASVTNSFAHAVFRFGHSQVSESMLLVNDANETVGSLSIAQAFFNPAFLQSPGNVELVLKGLASQVGQENDLLLVNGIRNQLFGPPGAGGLDLAALDIQRGRDHGLPDYNTLRKAYGLPKVTSFAEISSDLQIQTKLSELFGTVDNIDAFVGALAEDHLPGSSVGALIQAVVGNQFERLRDGDRFFYTTDAFLQSNGVRRIINLDTVSLGKVIRWNTGITGLQGNVFFAKSVSAVPDTGVAPAADNVVTTTDALAGSTDVTGSPGDDARAARVSAETARELRDLAIVAADGGLDIAAGRFLAQPIVPPNPIHVAPEFALNYLLTLPPTNELAALDGLFTALDNMSSNPPPIHSPLFSGLVDLDLGEDLLSPGAGDTVDV